MKKVAYEIRFRSTIGEVSYFTQSLPSYKKLFVLLMHIQRKKAHLILKT